LPQRYVSRYALVTLTPSDLILERFNDAAKRGVYSLQEYFALAGKAVGFIFVKPFYTADLFQQMDVIGVGSLGIVLLTGFFTGMVLALQLSVQLQQLGQTALVGKLITASMVRELGPVLAGLMVAGRWARASPPSGSMRVTEQIDALEHSGTGSDQEAGRRSARRSSCSPCLQSSMTSLESWGNINCSSRPNLGLPASLYWRTVFEQILTGGFTLRYIPNDFIQGLTKPFVFGGIISTVACYHGLKTSGGTEGVGLATTRTVVTASILILVVDYFLTQVLLTLFST
jgi:phospholipid/cholesterol/gamma-HCH transport system permease protein